MAVLTDAWGIMKVAVLPKEDYTVRLNCRVPAFNWREGLQTQRPPGPWKWRNESGGPGLRPEILTSWRRQAFSKGLLLHNPANCCHGNGGLVRSDLCIFKSQEFGFLKTLSFLDQTSVRAASVRSTSPLQHASVLDGRSSPNPHWGFWPCHKDTQAALWRVLYSKELRAPANGHVSEPHWKGISLIKSITSSDDSKFSLLFYCNLMRETEAEAPYK